MQTRGDDVGKIIMFGFNDDVIILDFNDDVIIFDFNDDYDDAA